ncbi:MAG TPA: hypothetical protein VFO34_13490 [Candidatus Acidoferrales bacterium]|nr:hypothetical protein [Candidatus Acidoferrales bacterium]
MLQRSLRRLAISSAVLAWLGCPSGLPANAQTQPGQSYSAPSASVASEKQITGYQPITNSQRVSWFLTSTVGPQSLTAGLFSAGIGTALNRPKEYGPHWDGFGDRYGIRLTGIATGNAMEAGLGALWGEDPRYVRATGHPFGSRLKNVFRLSVEHYRSDGHLAPAYAFYIATPGNNFLSNTWREKSEATVNDALLRTLWGYLGRVGSNAFQEFWPDVQSHVFHH